MIVVSSSDILRFNVVASTKITVEGVVFELKLVWWVDFLLVPTGNR